MSIHFKDILYLIKKLNILLFIMKNKWLVINIISTPFNDWLIACCLTPTLAIFQLYHGLNKFYVNLDT